MFASRSRWRGGSREQDGVDGGGNRRRVGARAELSSDRIRDRTHGAYPVPGLSQLHLPVVCVESRQAYQALKSLAAHRTDRNDARGLAHLARTGFFKPVHVKSLSAHAVRSLIIARKKLVGQRVTLENQIRGLAVVFGVRLPRALSAAFIDQALKASEGVAGLSAAMRGLIAARTAVMTAVAAIDADIRRMTRASDACRRLMIIPGDGQLTALAFVAAIDDPSRIRRCLAQRMQAGRRRHLSERLVSLVGEERRRAQTR